MPVPGPSHIGTVPSLCLPLDPGMSGPMGLQMDAVPGRVHLHAV